MTIILRGGEFLCDMLDGLVFFRQKDLAEGMTHLRDFNHYSNTLTTHTCMFMVPDAATKSSRWDESSTLYPSKATNIRAIYMKHKHHHF